MSANVSGLDWGDVGPSKAGGSLTPARLRILLLLLAVFTIWTYLAVSSGSPGDVRQRPLLRTTLATLTGPYVGAIARDGQSCCLDVSNALALIAGPFLLLGWAAQGVPLPFRRGETLFRLTAWTLGWLAWLFAGLVSFTHALF